MNKTKIAIISDRFDVGGVSYVINILSLNWCKYYDVKMFFFEKTKLAYDTHVDICFINHKPLIPVKFINKFINKFVYKFKLYLHLKKYSPDLIISFKTKPNIYTIMVAKNLKIPVIICEHGFHAGEKSNKTNKLRKKYYPKSNLLTVLTNADYKYYDFVKNKIIMPNPIDINLNENNIKKENIILYVGRLEPEKSVDVFIKAMSKIKNINQWRIQIAGDGSLKEELVELSKKYKLNIEFLGYIKNLHELYLKSKILCLTSEQEGLPVVLLESIIYNCIRISSDYIGVDELIIDNYNGLIFKKGDYLDLANKIDFIQENEQLCHNLTLNARKILNNFDKKNIFKKWDIIIKKYNKGAI